jgi:hypothetical protein
VTAVQPKERATRVWARTRATAVQPQVKATAVQPQMKAARVKPWQRGPKTMAARVGDGGEDRQWRRGCGRQRRAVQPQTKGAIRVQTMGTAPGEDDVRVQAKGSRVRAMVRATAGGKSRE